jgi:hypothetical protein
VLGWYNILESRLQDERLIEFAASMRTETMLVILSMISIISADDPPQIEKLHKLLLCDTQTFDKLSLHTSIFSWRRAYGKASLYLRI